MKSSGHTGEYSEADPGEGLRGLQPPPFRSICLLLFVFILPKSIINKNFLKSFPVPPFDCLSSYEKVMYISRNVYASKIKDLPFTIIADESTDPYSNQDILSLCLWFVDQSSPNDVKECLTNFMHLERTNATMISRKILKSLSDPSISLDPSNIRGQAYDGASVMSSGKEGVRAKIKEISPLALFIHCYAHCLNHSIATSCKLSEVRNLIGLINEAYLFLINSPKRQQLFELTLKEYLPENSHGKLPGLCKTRWVKRHTCLDLFLEMYELLVTFLDADISPHEYPNLKSSTEAGIETKILSQKPRD